MRRRDFVVALGGAAAAWPLTVRAQQGDRTRRVGALMSFTENDPEGQTFVAAFREELQKLGWTDGHNIRIDTRWATPGDDRLGEKLAKEFVALQPELILSQNTPTTQRCCSKLAPFP
jgi:putative ABC transport system substrate-binding protein